MSTPLISPVLRKGNVFPCCHEVVFELTGWATLGDYYSFRLTPSPLSCVCRPSSLLCYWWSCHHQDQKPPDRLLHHRHPWDDIYLRFNFPTPEKRDELRRQHLAQQDAAASTRHKSLDRLTSMIAVAFEPLKQLAPTRRADGRRN
jgi:hypothetical protein